MIKDQHKFYDLVSFGKHFKQTSQKLRDLLTEK